MCQICMWRAIGGVLACILGGMTGRQQRVLPIATDRRCQSEAWIPKSWKQGSTMNRPWGDTEEYRQFHVSLPQYTKISTSYREG